MVVYRRTNVRRPLIKSLESLNAKIVAPKPPTFKQIFMTYAEKRLTNPTFLVPLLLSIVLIYSYSADSANKKTTNYVHSVIVKIIANPQTASMGIWLKNNILFFFGMIAFIPTIIATPESKRVTVVAGLVLYFFIIPMKSPYEYIAEAMLLYLYNGTSVTSIRMSCIMLAFFLYFVQFSKFLPAFSHFDYTTPSPTPAPTTT